MEEVLKYALLSAGALALSGTLAAAADLPARNLPVRNAPIVAPLPLFAGFYGGLGVGGGWSRDRYSETSLCTPSCGAASPTVTATGSGSGATGSAFAGFSWRFNAMVLGVEGEFGASNIKSTHTIPGSEPDSVTSRLIADGSVRLRAGYVMGPVLAYLTGGVAFGQIRHTYNVYTSTAPYTLTGSAETERWRTGWTIGGGLEWAFAPLWTARVEYRYTDFGRNSDLLGPPLYVSNYSERHHETFNTIRVGVVRYF